MESDGRIHTMASLALALVLAASTTLFAMMPAVLDIPDSGEAEIGIVPGSFSSAAETPVVGDPTTLSVTVEGDQSGGVSWVKRGVVLDIGGIDQEKHVYQPSVIQLDNDTLEMYYAGVDTAGIYRIFRAFSFDGLTWQKLGVVLDSGTPYANNGVMQPQVRLRPDGTRQMWYVGQNYESGVNRQRVLVANSTDGGASFEFVYAELNFGEPTAPDSVQYPYVLEEANGFQLFYTGVDWGTTNRWINRAHKSGIYDQWQMDGTVLTHPGGGCGAPVVRRNNEGMLEMYHGRDNLDGTWGIHLSTSSDGLAWQYADSIILPTLPYESKVITSPSVIGEDGNLRMWYGAMDSTTVRILYAEQASVDPGLDATCDVSFYDGFVAPENLIGTVAASIPADARTTVSLDWVPTTAGVHTLTAVINGVAPTDPDLSDNTATLAVTVAAPEPACISITKTMVSGIESGFTLTYYEWELLITVENTGQRTATDVVVLDVLPAEFLLLNGTASTGSMERTTNPGVTKASIGDDVSPVRSTHLTWLVGDMAPGASETLLLQVCTRVNGGGNQEFTSAGIYILNEGAYGHFVEGVICELTFFGPTPPITVIVADKPDGLVTPGPILDDCLIAPDPFESPSRPMLPPQPLRPVAPVIPI